MSFIEWQQRHRIDDLEEIQADLLTKIRGLEGVLSEREGQLRTLREDNHRLREELQCALLDTENRTPTSDSSLPPLPSYDALIP